MSDNAFGYRKSVAFAAVLADLGARHILIRPHCPWTNGKVERLHRTIEEECLWKVVRDEVSDLEAVQYRLNIYAGWYNTKRRHGGYRMHCTPRQKIEQWIINNKASELYEGNVNETLVLYKALEVKLLTI